MLVYLPPNDDLVRWSCGECGIWNDDENVCGHEPKPLKEFQVMYHRQGRSLEQWKKSDIVVGSEMLVRDLAGGTVYQCILRWRIPKGRNKRSRFSLPKKKQVDEWTELPVFQFHTLSNMAESRIGLKSRIAAFENGILDAYPEDDAVPDTYASKAVRVGEKLIHGAGAVGFGGNYIKTMKQLMKLKQSGLVSVVLNQDLASMVYALTSYISAVAGEYQLSTTDITLGSYYMIWERKRERLLFPDLDNEDHEKYCLGVLNPDPPIEMLDEMSKYFALSEIAYGSTAAEIQWVLRKYPNQMELIMFRGRADKYKPAFILVGSKKERCIYLVVRGTHEVDDLVTDFDFTEKPFKYQGQTYQVHSGMLQAATWIFDGKLDLESVIDDDLEDGAGIGEALLGFFRGGYEIKLCGHSLGSGCVALLGLLLGEMDKDIKVDVYGFGSPPVVDENLAELCKPNARISVRHLIFRDDIVSRLSFANARLFASEIKRFKPRWEVLMKQDRMSFVDRAKGLWAPVQRGDRLTNVRKTSDPEGSKRFSFNRNHDSRLVIPGEIVHVFIYRGTYKMALVDHRFGGFANIEPSEMLINDHKMSHMHKIFRNVRAARKASCPPPPWQSTEDHKFNGLYVKCIVCEYFVGWHHTGDSEAVEVRATHHCRACGMIVCDRCSTSRTALPSIGIVSEVRICDSCYHFNV